MVGDQACIGIADVADTEAKKQFAQWDTALVFDRFKEFLCTFCTPTFAVFQLLQPLAISLLQRKNIGGGLDPAIHIELLDLFCAKPVDVKRGPTDEMFEPLDRLRRTDQTARATAHGIAVLADGRRPTFGANILEKQRVAHLCRAATDQHL